MKTDKVKEVENILYLFSNYWRNDPQNLLEKLTPQQAAQRLNQMLIKAKEDGVKFARLKIEELASKEMRDGRHRYSDEIETILEALKAEKEK